MSRSVGAGRGCGVAGRGAPALRWREPALRRRADAPRCAPAAIRVACVALAALLPAAAARATDCGAAATQQAANACEHERFVASGAPMADAYRRLSAALEPGPRDALRREQKAWLAWRAAACDYEASGTTGGSAAPMVRARCASRLTDARTAELVRRLDDCPEGDLACPARRR